MPLLTTPTLEIDYEEHGSPTGPPVLLLHGFPDSKAAWRPVLQYLLGQDHPTPRLIVPSLRGYGETRLHPGQEPTGQPSALATDILELLDALHVGKALLVGHDWGARASYAASILAPDRVSAIVALATSYTFAAGPVPSLEQAHAHWYQFLFQQQSGEDAFARDPAAFGAYLWRAWSPEWQFAPEELAEAQAAWTQAQLPRIVVTYYRARHGNNQSPARYAEAQKLLDAKPPIPVPVFWAQALGDHCELPGSSGKWEKYCPAGMEQVDIRGAGHFLPHEAPEQVAQLVRRALKTNAP